MSLTSSPEIASLKRWIKASFKDALLPRLAGANLFVEGQERLSSRDKSHFELRIDGPYLRNSSGNEYCAFIEVNILSSSTRNEDNVFERENLQGQMQYALNTDVCIYRTGNVGKVVEDDETLVGTMQLISSHQIKVSDFGMIDPNTEVFQAVAEAHYEMYFTLG